MSASAAPDATTASETPQKTRNITSMSPSSDNVLDIDSGIMDRIGCLSANCHSSAALLFRWARHPSFSSLCDFLTEHNITGPYIAWLGQWAMEPGSACHGDLFAVLDSNRVTYDVLKSKLNAMADMHEAHNPTGHLHRIQ